MSLNSILGVSTAGLVSVQSQISVVNANVANASEEGYTRKSYEASSAITGLSALTEGQVTRAADAYLSKTVTQNAGASGRAAVVDEYLALYDASIGSVDGGDDLSALVSAFQTALSELASSPDESSAQAQAISDAEALAGRLNDLSAEVQSLRTQANQQIGDTVDSINATLEELESLNDQITRAANAGLDTGDLLDRRDSALESLSSMMGVSYTTASDGRVTVYSESGDLLLGSKATTLSYTPAARLGADVAYPDGVSGITINGRDVTTSLTQGTLGGLISLRDEVLVDEQAKLDSLAGALIEEMNAAANLATAYPAPQSLTSARQVGGSDSLAGTGEVRIAVTTSSGELVASADLDLSSYATLDDLVAALDAIDGLSASLGADGTLTLTADDTANGVAIGALDSDIGGQSFSAYFGFNDLFSGTGADDISVAATSETLGVARLSEDAVAVGDRVLTASDAEGVQALIDALEADHDFAASGDLAARSTSLQGYASAVVSSTAQAISGAASKAEDAQSAYDSAKTSLSNKTAVNMDEELALLTQLQTQYNANAQLVSAAKDLFDTLLEMVQ